LTQMEASKNRTKKNFLIIGLLLDINIACTFTVAGYFDCCLFEKRLLFAITHAR